MDKEKNDNKPNEEPPPATQDILKKSRDPENGEPPHALQDILKFNEKQSGNKRIFNIKKDDLENRDS